MHVLKRCCPAGRRPPARAARRCALRGLDNPAYYRLDRDDPSQYYDTTGTGNSLNAGNPVTLRLIMDSLPYWLTEMHVDGFRFDLASTLAAGLHSPADPARAGLADGDRQLRPAAAGRRRGAAPGRRQGDRRPPVRFRAARTAAGSPAFPDGPA